MIKHIRAYDESWYTGDYEYVYDPDHQNRPKGQGWYLTEKGWARGRNQEQGHVPSRVVHNPSVFPWLLNGKFDKSVYFLFCPTFGYGEHDFIIADLYASKYSCVFIFLA